MKSSHLQLPSGIRLPVTRCGDPAQPPVVLIHGWCCRRADWTTTLNELSDEFHGLAIDLPGHGEARDQLPERWTVTALADAVVEAIKDLGLENIRLVGHSMGGAVALEAATRLPSVHKVVLVDTFIIPYGDLSEEDALNAEQPFRKDFVRSVHGLVANSTAASLSDDTRQTLQALMTEANPQHMLPLWADLLRWQPDHSFQTLAANGVHIAAINGERIPESARSRCGPFVEETVLPGAVHFPQFEVPEAFFQSLRAALR